MKLEKINSMIHGKTKAYRIIMDDDEVFEVVRSDDPELTSKKKKKYNSNFFRNTKELIWFSNEGLNLCDDRVKLYIWGKGKSYNITELTHMVTVVETLRELRDLLKLAK